MFCVKSPVNKNWQLDICYWASSLACITAGHSTMCGTCLLIHIFMQLQCTLDKLSLISIRKCYYRTHSIITYGLYIFNPLFKVQKQFFKEVFFLEKFCIYVCFYSRTVSNQERVMMVCVRYVFLDCRESG